MSATPKYTIWSPGRPRPPLKPGQTCLRLIQEHGVTKLVACDANGRQLSNANLLSFDSRGSITAHSGVSRAANLALTGDGTIAIYVDGEIAGGPIAFSPTLPT